MEKGNEPEPKICSACGESFGCGANKSGCWCVDVAVPADTAADLKERFTDCLCPTCLKMWVEKGEPQHHGGSEC